MVAIDGDAGALAIALLAAAVDTGGRMRAVAANRSAINGVFARWEELSSTLTKSA